MQILPWLPCADRLPHSACCTRRVYTARYGKHLAQHRLSDLTCGWQGDWLPLYKGTGEPHPVFGYGGAVHLRNCCMAKCMGLANQRPVQPN